MSLVFPADSAGNLTGTPYFSLLSKFSFPGPVISVYILDPFRKLLSAYIYLKDTETLGLYTLLDWTKQTSCFIDTGIDCVGVIMEVFLRSYSLFFTAIPSGACLHRI